MASFEELFPLSTLPDGKMRRVSVKGSNLVIVHQGSDLFALQDRCSHEDFSLSEGFLEPGKIGCALHGATFDLRSGTALSLPAYEDICAYPVRIRNGMVEVEI